MVYRKGAARDQYKKTYRKNLMFRLKFSKDKLFLNRNAGGTSSANHIAL